MECIKPCEDFLQTQTKAFEDLIACVCEDIKNLEAIEETMIRLGQFMDLQAKMVAVLKNKRQKETSSKQQRVSLLKLVHGAHDALNKYPPRHELASAHIYHAIHLLKLGEPVVPASVRKRVIQQLNVVIELHNQIANHACHQDQTQYHLMQPLDPHRLGTYQSGPCSFYDALPPSPKRLKLKLKFFSKLKRMFS
jgi:hypothetical protein